jgi:hypothetical protein
MARSMPFLFIVFLLVSGCAPVCVLYPTQQEPVSIPDVPKGIMDSFHKACPDTRIVSVSKEMGGKNGTQLIFWVIRFAQDGKFREDLISSANDKPYIYDVQN